MYCPRCARLLPDTAAFCAGCGTQLRNFGSVPQQDFVPPQQNWTPPQQGWAPVPSREPTKKEFLASPAGSAARKRGWLVVLTMLAVLALMAANVLVFLNTPVLNLSSLSRAIRFLDSRELQQAAQLLEEDLENILEALEIPADMLTNSQQRTLEELADSLRLVVRRPTLNNLAAFAETYSRSTRRLMIQLGVPLEVTAALETAVRIMKVLPTLIWGLFFLPMVFALLSGLLKNTPLTVAAMVLTLLPQLLLGIHLITAATLLIYILQTVLCSAIQSDYKKHRLVPMYT